MTYKHFIWPKPTLRSSIYNSFRLISTEDVENRLATMFSGGYPVLYSSARSALCNALAESNLSRSDTVGVFPYASHCVLDTISRIATPNKLSVHNPQNLVYHQWGYIYENSFISSNIEDAVDSLLTFGRHLFPTRGNFEIWSLPKIVATSGGGVLWCRSKPTALKLRKLRDEKPYRNILWFLRLLGLKSHLIYAMWQGAEAFFGRPSSFLLSEVDTSLDNWNALLLDRQAKLDIAWQFAPIWLPKPVDRLPCVVPIEIKQPLDLVTLENKLPISSLTRHFVRPLLTGKHDIVPTIPVPIHQDISISDLSMILDHISVFLGT